MPIYEYQFETCGLKFERRQAITAEPLTECPACRGEVQRLLSGGAGFLIKKAGGNNPRGAAAGECSMERTGKTCCGREERCGKPPCGDRR